MMRFKLYLQDTYNELVNKVSWPTWAELRSSAVIVLIASLIIALVIYIMDFSFSNMMKFIYNIFY